VAVDIIIEMPDRGLVLIQRARPPWGWALPGGFVDYGESLEDAARREAWEETSLTITLAGQLGSYSDPGRDPRGHVISTVFVATAQGHPRAADDARHVEVFPLAALPRNLAFDHGRILADYLHNRAIWLERIKIIY
jgi:8-oxo-dGTP diphosphatase